MAMWTYLSYGTIPNNYALNGLHISIEVLG